MVIVNIGHPEDSHDLERSAGRDHARLPFVDRDEVEPTNTGIARAAPVSARRAAPVLRAARHPTERRRRLRPRRGGGVFTDDRAPVEWLVDALDRAGRRARQR
jgi:hypothetical protein